jgi:hypothetical protein
MISTPEFQGLGERMLDAMDRELLLLVSKHREMEQLLAAITGRDNAVMEKLMTGMEQAQQEQNRADRAMERISSELAAEVGCPKARPRLSELTRYLPPDLALAMEERRQALTGGLRRLRQKHMEVSVMLHECQKMNRIMLECLLRESSPPRTYGANGSLQRGGNSGVMSAEL